ncbi:MAG: metallophosphoesterase family protein [Candidatus Hydrogenedentes bacterium]|nr:metallophosphoesterase family protein [Candidatus Hydrogenedentota bacterium]
MLFAALGDIRGNTPALRRVLDELSDSGIQTVVNTGDSTVGRPWTKEVIEALEAAHITSVQGGRDRLLVRFARKGDSLRDRLPEADFEALERAYAQCSSRDIEYLAALPSRARFAVDGVSVELCHGGLTSLADRLRPADDPALFRRQRELTDARIIVCGHGEEAFVRLVEDTLFVHPGSVGMATDGRAHYALISTETDPWSAELHSVEFESVEDPR